jgi:hypothetical protein
MSLDREAFGFSYGRLKRAQKAVVLRFLEWVSGNSRQQLTPLRALNYSPTVSGISRTSRFLAKGVSSPSGHVRHQDSEIQVAREFMSN